MTIFWIKALNAYRFSINVFTFLMVVFVVACKERADNPNANLQLSHYATLRQSSYALNSHQIRRYIAQLKKSDTDSMMSDMRCTIFCIGALVIKHINVLQQSVQRGNIARVAAIGISPCWVGRRC